jgi:amino acid adenylation domain-containing protein
LELVMVSASLQEVFAVQVERTPDATAVSGGAVRLTYRELDERANRLAHRLIGLGVTPDAPVAVQLRRSADLVVATLAILKAGGCYVPLHDAYPPERKQWIVDSLGSPVLLADTESKGDGLAAAATTLLLDSAEEVAELAALPATDPGRPADPGQLAYVIHTSGSTGEPKGVAVTHRDALGLALDPAWEGGRHERVLMVAPYAFNVSTYELWVPLLHGGEIVLAPPGNLDVESLRALLAEHRITGVHLTAGLFRVLAEEAPEALSGVREVLTGGDVIAPAAVRRALEANPDLVVRGMYGSTETTLFATHEPMTAPFDGGDAIPIGGPLAGVRAYVLDEHLVPVAPGGTGELYLAGRGVARGYHGKPDQTADRFVADPFGEPGERMYRTGDLVSVGAGDRLVFVGRVSGQVKIRGFRVSLGEVEAVLAKHDGLAHVAVVAREGDAGDQRLAAYLVSGGGEIDLPSLKAHAARLLPDYMVPAWFVVLDALPLTPNGKIDRAALPEPEAGPAVAYVAPRNPRQETLCAIFAEVLAVDRVGIEDSFFDLGGQSLLAMKLISRIRAALEADLSITDLFDEPTPAGLDALLDAQA